MAAGLAAGDPLRDDPKVHRPQRRLVMKLTLRSLFLLIAVILFVAAAIGSDLKGISLSWLGMAFFAGSFLVPETSLGRR